MTTSAPPPDPRFSRLAYIDWLRGVAVLSMIMWHSLDAWTVLATRSGSLFAIIILLGGWAAPLFLFLAGVSVALAGSKSISSGRSGTRHWAPGTGLPSAQGRAPSAESLRRLAGSRLQKRGWEIFGLAHVFRLQSFLLNPTASWSSLLKPDILNILGLGLVAVAFCWSRATSRAREVLWLLLPAAVIVFMTPASRLWIWPALFRPYAPRLEAYIRPINGVGVFSVFPWVAFVFVGAIAGNWIASARARGEDARFPLPLALAGLGLLAGGAIGARLPALTPSSFWTTSLSFFLIRCGAMTMGMTAAWVWLRRPTAAHFSPLVVMGRASLFVYWVHVELAYGVFTQPLHYRLPLPLAIAAFLLFTAFMVGLTLLWNRRRRPTVPTYLSPLQLDFTQP